MLAARFSILVKICLNLGSTATINIVHQINPNFMLQFPVKMGLWMFAGFVSFFLLMFFLGFGHRSELRVFNGIIHFFCMYQVIQAYYLRHPEKFGDYMSGVLQAAGASAIGVGGFILFMNFFLSFNPTLMETIRQNSQVGEYLRPFTVSLFILTEGIVVTLVGSYILTRLVEVNLRKA